VTAPLPRIVHVASGREWRGGQRQVHLLAAALHRQQVDQVVVTSRGSELARRLERSGVRCHPVDWRRGLSLAALRAVWSECRRGPAILHAHDAHALILAGLVAPLSRTPFVVTRRVDFPIRRPGFWIRADRVIAISDAVRAVLIRGGIPADRITVVHSAIDLDATRAVAAGSIRSQLGLPDAAPLAVSVAALVPHKDHETMLRAAAIVHRSRPDLHWALAGDGPLRDRIETLARDLGVTPVIHLLGSIDRPLELIRAGSVFVMSSAEEGLGTSVLDAMALDVPVVATRAGGIPEMLDQGAGILVPVGNPEALAMGIETVLADSTRRNQLIATARERVAGFGAHGMAAGVLSVYRSVRLER